MKHRHVPVHIQQQQIRQQIALQGFAVQQVQSTGKDPDFTYTVGLHHPGTNSPELFISGLLPATRVFWMMQLGYMIQGPPPVLGQQHMARLQGVAAKDLTFPPGGRVFQSGVRYLDLAENALPTCFGEVERQYYQAHFGQAFVYHGAWDFPVLQVVWPDTKGHFPFEAGFEERFKGQQRLLFTPPQTPLLPPSPNDPVH